MFIISPTKLVIAVRGKWQFFVKDHVKTRTVIILTASTTFTLRADAATNARANERITTRSKQLQLQNQIRSGSAHEMKPDPSRIAVRSTTLTATDINFVKNADPRNPETIQRLGGSHKLRKVKTTQNAP